MKFLTEMRIRMGQSRSAWSLKIVLVLQHQARSTCLPSPLPASMGLPAIPPSMTRTSNQPGLLHAVPEDNNIQLEPDAPDIGRRGDQFR